jgi:hypothetical protein
MQRPTVTLWAYSAGSATSSWVHSSASPAVERLMVTVVTGLRTPKSPEPVNAQSVRTVTWRDLLTIC